MEKLQIAVALFAVFVTSRVVIYFRAAKRTGYLPGLRSLVTPISLFGAAIPTCRLNPGLNWQWEWRKQVYSRAGTDTISVLPWLSGTPAIYTRSFDVARQILSTKGQFYKATPTVAITLIWGPNIFAANGEDWKRHRRIITPAFCNATYVSVWKETARVVDEMVTNEGWLNKSLVEIPSMHDLTYKYAMILIATCGFGHRLGWKLDKSSSDDMSFGEAMEIIVDSHILLLILPKWAYSLPVKRFRDAARAYKTLLSFMQNLIDTSRNSLSAGAPIQNDILSLMIESNENEDKLTMDDSELIGNTFLLLFAGHDTTARTLDASFAFLALYESFQEECYQEIMEVMPTDADFTFENSSRLVKVQACFLEAARIFPAGFMLIRDTAEDVVLRNVGPKEDEVIMVPRNTRCVVDVIGLHHNEKQFEDPDTFKPSRWYNVHENDLTMFSLGPRACIGRRFALTEGICYLARVLRNWKVMILPEGEETKEKWSDRVLRGYTIMNFGIGKVPVRLVRRDQ